MEATQNNNALPQNTINKKDNLAVEFDLFGNQTVVYEDNRKGYDKFVNKFKPKLTTDDCYTPAPVYDIVLDFLYKRNVISKEQKIIRPFYPNMDYKKEEYPEGCVVVDNPPFSILSEIVRYFNEHKIKYFLFAPHLTLFSILSAKTYIICGASIVYHNGAKIPTSFISNLFGDVRLFSDYELFNKIENLFKKDKRPKYKYPDELITVYKVTHLLKRGVEVSINKNECHRVSKLDSQRKCGIFGNGLLVSDKRAKEIRSKEIIEKQKNIVDETIHFDLSDREKKIVRGLGKDCFHE